MEGLLTMVPNASRQLELMGLPFPEMEIDRGRTADLDLVTLDIFEVCSPAAPFCGPLRCNALGLSATGTAAVFA